MEQIVIYYDSDPKKLIPLEDRKTQTRLTKAEQRVGLLGEDVVTLTVESPYPQEYRIGAKLKVFGREYTMNQLPVIKKQGAHAFSYDLSFEGVQYELSRAQYEICVDTEGNKEIEVYGDALMGNLELFMKVLVKNANRLYGENVIKWRLGTCPETDYRNLTFSCENCLSVLQRLCEEFEQEFEIEREGDINVIHIREAGKTIDKTFQYGRGKGLYELSRQNVSSDNIITRLRVFGGTNNLGPDYRNDRLCLQGKSKINSYIDDASSKSQYGIWEATKYFDEVCPTMKSKVTAIGSSVYEFVDNKMFDLNEKVGTDTKYLIDKVLPKVHFNTGNLAGYQFEVNYDHSTHTFKLKEFTDEQGMVFPSKTSSAFQIAKDDEYVLLDIRMPDDVIEKAEKELNTKGTAYLKKHCQPKVQYALTFEEAYLRKTFGQGEAIPNIFGVGDYVKVTDTDINVNKSLRITSFTRDILSPYKYVLTIGETTHVNLYNRLISKLNLTSMLVNRSYLADPAVFRTNTTTTYSFQNKVLDGEGYYRAEAFKPGSISKDKLSLNTLSSQFSVNGALIRTNYNGIANSLKVDAGTLSHYAFGDSARNWSIASSQVSLSGNGVGARRAVSTDTYNVYAECSKEGSEGKVIVTTDTYEVESEGSSYYYFLLGTIDSGTDGKLTANLAYGASPIDGKYLTTGRIGSEAAYLDLESGEIGGTIKYKASGDGAFRNVSDLEKDVSSLGESVSSLDGRIDFLKSDFTSLDVRIGSLDESVSSLHGRVDSLKGDFTAFNSDFTSLKSEVSSYEATLSRVSSLEQTVYNGPSKVPGIGGPSDGDGYIRTFYFRDEKEAQTGFVLSIGEEMEAVEYDFINETDVTATIRAFTETGEKAIYWRNLPVKNIVLPGKFARVHVKSVLPKGEEVCSWLIMNTSDFVVTEENGERNAEYIMM